MNLLNQIKLLQDEMDDLKNRSVNSSLSDKSFTADDDQTDQL